MKVGGEERKADKDRELAWQRTRRELNVSKVRGEEGGEMSVERTMVRSLQLIPECDEEKVTERFRRSEKKAVEFGWCSERWVGLVANELKGKALEAYEKCQRRIWSIMRSLRLKSCGPTSCVPRPIICSSGVVGSERVSPTSCVLTI